LEWGCWVSPSMTDTEAIALYVAAGNPREDWAALDDRDRWPWRKMALEGTRERSNSLLSYTVPKLDGRT
jgi:hypothetical protein